MMGDHERTGSAADGRAGGPRRLVVFADPCQAAPAVLLPALVSAVDCRTDIVFAGLLLSRPPLRWLERSANHAERSLQRLLGTGRFDAAARTLAGDVLASVRQRRLPIVVVPNGDPNDESVVALVRDSFAAQIGLNLYCMRRFKPTLIECLDQCVNYHNGRLPQMRGIRASNWSIYAGESQSGFTFHRMDAQWDSGAILLEDEVPVHERDTAGDLEVRKATSAAARLPLLLDAMLRGDAGRPQMGSPSYHSAAKLNDIRRVPDPSLLTAAEWQRRIRAFARIEARLERGWVGLTGLSAAPAGSGLGFYTTDRQWLRVMSIDFRPTWMARFGGHWN